MSMKIVYLLLQLQYLQHPIKKPAPNGAGLKQKAQRVYNQNTITCSSGSEPFCALSASLALYPSTDCT